MSSADKNFIKSLLKKADISVGGERPWDIQVTNEEFYSKVLKDGSLGLGESYMWGWWECKALDQFSNKLLDGQLHNKVKPSLQQVLSIAHSKIFNLQTKSGSLKVAKEHYDLPADLYMSFLDKYNQYTCGYFKNTKDLDTAQEQKLELICKKLHLKKTDRVLDIGCGWGGFAKYAATHYGCSVTGVTISQEQAKYARAYVSGLPVKIVVQDYRDITGTFDKVVVVGMIEHVGHKNYKRIMQKVHEVLTDDGIFLLHTIGTHDSVKTTDPWLTRYIFPNSELPAPIALTNAIGALFVMEDWHNFGHYYDPTLMAWCKKFDKNWSKLKDRYDETFYRMFKYYFLMCAGAFRARNIQLWQIALTKKGLTGGYETFR